jgi:hypothetical protein
MRCVVSALWRSSYRLLQERSLTTIMYLTSLTELSRTPFSLVDEINQVRMNGLARREMISPGRFCDDRVWTRGRKGSSTTRWSRSLAGMMLDSKLASLGPLDCDLTNTDVPPFRYFLITPKLLTNLRYDKRMSVLCIYNGQSRSKCPRF